MIKITTPFTAEAAKSLRAGDEVLINGTILTGRDAAHRRLYELHLRGEPLPVDLQDKIIYFVGPTPTPLGRAIGSAGPTTSGRMDLYSPTMLENYGLRGMIGKGKRNDTVKSAIREFSGVYFSAIGGLAALLSECVTDSKIILYEDLGPEAIYELEVKDFPVLVINDCFGGDAYEENRAKWRNKFSAL